MVARAERSGPSLLYAGVRQRWACHAVPRQEDGCVTSQRSSTDEQLRVPLRSAFGYSDPQLTGTLDSLDTMRIGGHSAPTMVAHARSGGRPDRRARAAVCAGAGHPGVLVYPGMEVRQGTNVCTLGYVDPQMRIAFTAGHCRGSGQVTDRDGNVIGTQSLFRDNTPNGATVDTNHQIADWEAISLSPDVAVNNVLPGGRQLIADPAIVPVVGMPVCHFGVITGESCGTIQAVNNGWFTMANGVVSQKGDSGGPVYNLTPDGRAAIIGMFNSTWGQYPAAVSWQVASQQAREDVISAAAGSVTRPAARALAEKLENRDRRCGSPHFVVGRLWRQAADVTLDLPVPPVEIRFNSCGLASSATSAMRTSRLRQRGPISTAPAHARCAPTACCRAATRRSRGRRR